ncbi:MAG TPA: hypothetical protein VJJ83_02240 [Candidatus Babeliales bacterium]|nr:hypothetical protein [Candidatus Babeliales bacterium]
MLRSLVKIALFTLTLTKLAGGACDLPDYTFYLKVGSGAAVSELATVRAPYPPWYPALQGYNAKLGVSPIISFGVGCELAQLLDLELNIANRATFKYRKHQTPTIGSDAYTREFDLNITSVLIAANLLGLGVPALNWEVGGGRLYQVLGVGLGVSDLLITNFRTTGLPATGDSAPYASFSTENQYTRRRNFTYTLLTGLEYNYQNCWVLGSGYRYFNAGNFSGPQYLRTGSGGAVDVGAATWQIPFRANEWFIEFKLFI